MKKFKPHIFATITSFLFLTFCSMTSFLFPIHSRVDQNIFFTVGRGILDGKVPYRDLFEHKGPLIYFMHTFGALFSRESFIGVFILQVIFFAVCIYYMYKTARLFTTTRAAYVCAALAGAVCCTTYCFKYGDNAEEFCFTFLMISLYYLLRYFKSADNALIKENRRNGAAKEFLPLISYKVVLINGILAGCVLWIKFTQLGFWIAWMGLVFFLLIFQKETKRAFLSCFVYLGGMALSAIPWLIYFGLNDAIGIWFETYFYNNIFMYAKDNTIIDKVVAVFKCFIVDLGKNPLAMVLIIVGFVSFGISKKYFKSFFSRLAVPVTFLTLYIMTYIGGVQYDYYMLIAVPFVLFGVIKVVDCVREMPDMWVMRAYNCLKRKKGDILPMTIAGILLMVYVIGTSNVLPYYGKEKEDFPQFVFADVINETEDATLLNYGFIDAGFYLASGYEPDNRFFCKVNIDQEVFPEMYEEQISMVRDRKVDYAVIRTYKNQAIAKGMRLDYKDLFENYEIIKVADDPFENYRFYLMKLK